MQQYIGTKQILARPMNRKAYNEYRGWELPANENGDDEGYLVEYIDSPNPNHLNHTNYISWSPKEQFDNAYRPTNGLTFGLAIEHLRKGRAVARRGWNGKGIFIGLYSPGPSSDMTQEFIFIDTGSLNSDNPDAIRGRVPWLASQTDMLAEDWETI